MEQPQSWPLRLINVRTLRLKQVHGKAPQYAIMSHTWGEEEISFQEWENGGSAVTLKEGYLKVVNACKQAERDGFEWLWADSVCIDKTNNSELAESIQCMYAWYHNAEVCYALLSDVDGAQTLTGSVEPADVECRSSVSSADRVQQFRESRYFTRGWTLQETIAPRKLVFYSKDWTLFDALDDPIPAVSQITKIPEAVLRHEKKLSECTFAQRLSWASDRETKRVEDQAYSLLGTLDVVMPPHYGEGSKAFLRLQKVLLSEEGGMTVLAWDSSHELAQSACLLAPSLACFRESGDIEAELSSLTTAEYSFTNIGLSGYFPVILRPTTAGEHILTPLHCYRKGKPHEILALSLGALHTNTGRGGSVECYVSPAEYSNVRRTTSATRLAVVNPSQQSLMINITIRSSPADIARLSRGTNQVVERSSDGKALKRSRHGSGEALVSPATIPPKDEPNPVGRLVDGSDHFAGDLYKAIGHSLVAFIGAAMSETTNVGIDFDSTAVKSRGNLQQSLESVLSDQKGNEQPTGGLQTTTMTQLQGLGAAHSPVDVPDSLSGSKDSVDYEPDAAFFHQLPSYVRAPAHVAARTMPMLQAGYGSSSSKLALSYSDKVSPTPSWLASFTTGKGGRIGPPTIAPFQQRRFGSTLGELTGTSPVDVTRLVTHWRS
ncbi:hypothetical protein LTR56_003088 [Elasticomyces elasticus]|nr:hypothetical protein LTR56_003088 [Elasticomyces elasticus]KAK3662150.1 hypothetical protein LTR22_007123 [Elasticomyces elasticus]KAK4927488.1 hypothetical protein LTR49_005628 [Elasticomyces elasticus]KAK5749742.1 hypothetical protein LTS12_020170 [Elasticomyces elasticus]